MLPFFRIAIVPDRCYRETQFSPWTPGERQKHSPGPARIGRRLTKNHGVCASLRLLLSSVFQRFSDMICAMTQITRSPDLRIARSDCFILSIHAE